MEEYSFLRFHGDGQFELENKNVADLMGDTVFICTSAIFDTRPDSSSITWWKVPSCSKLRPGRMASV